MTIRSKTTLLVLALLFIPNWSFALGRAPIQAFDAIEESFDHVMYIHPKDPAIISLAQEITASSHTDMERLHAIHNWVASNINYDDAAIKQITATTVLTTRESMNDLDVLKNHKGICQGYSDLTAALLKAVGIQAKVVAGSAYTDGKLIGNHAWNKALIDGRWVILDTSEDRGSPPLQEYFDPAPGTFAIENQENAEI